MAGPEATATRKSFGPNFSVIEVIRHPKTEQYFEAARGTLSALQREAKPRH